ncbi:hypothetical protein M5689_004617 [Euphorbia peplus]|nr:hypothetical protein M5689_004617 [Euphorbia peplus]
MVKLEAEVWHHVGCKCEYIKETQRAKYVSWDSGKTHTYHCHVDAEGCCRFKGPYLSVKRNLLQRTLGDDNVLMVKVAEDTSERISTSRINDFSGYLSFYQ